MKNKRKKIGLALGSGGLRGYSHIGVIQALVENDIPIDIVTGSSAGSLIGGFFAYMQDIQKVRSIWENIHYKTVLKLFSDPELRTGLTGGKKIIEYLRSHLGGTLIENLPIKYGAVSTDMQTGEIILHKEGDLVTAIRCSCGVPFLMAPYKFGDRMLIDGGAAEPVPVSSARNLGADHVIAVNLDSSFFSSEKKRFSKDPSSISTLSTTIDLFRYHLAKENVKNADIIIDPGITNDLLKNFRESTEIIKTGYRKTIEQIEKIKKLLS